MQSVCFTGTCLNMTRAELAEKAGKKFEVRGSVTKGLDILVCENPNGASAKIEKARKEGIRIIGYGEFLDMLDDIQDDGVFFIRNGVLEECEAWKIESAAIPEGVKRIEYGVFKGQSSLKSVVLPASLREIRLDAFEGCGSLSEITFGGTMEQWEKVSGRQHLLQYVPAKSVKCSDGEWQKPIFLASSGTLYACVDRSATSVTIGGDVSFIDKNTFADCTALTSLVICEGVRIISDNAFKNCTSLASIELPSTLSLVDKTAFAGCENVRKIVSASTRFPFNEKTGKLYDAAGKSRVAILSLMAGREEAKKEKIRRVQNASAGGVLDSIMGGRNANAEVVRDEKNARLRITTGDGGFELLLADSKAAKWMQVLPAFLDLAEAGADSAALKKFADENGLEDSAKKYVTLSKDGSVKWKKKTEPVHLFIPSGVSAIAADGFRSCDSLKFAAIPGSVTEIGSWAFSWCKSLERVAIPDSVTEIRDAAFYACKSLKSFEVPPKVVKISSYSFDCCYSLGKIAIGEGVEEIRVGAFRWCESLKSVELPSTIRRLEGQSFVDCRALEEIRYNGTTAQWKAVEKERCWNENVPAKVVKCADGEEPIAIKTEDFRTETYSLKIIDGGLRKCSCTPDARKVVVPDGVTEIDPEALSGEAVESLEIPASMARFGSCALNGCSSLSEIIFRGTIEQWNAIEKRNDWNKDVPARTAKCADGDASI